MRHDDRFPRRRLPRLRGSTVGMTAVAAAIIVLIALAHPEIVTYDSTRGGWGISLKRRPPLTELLPSPGATQTAPVDDGRIVESRGRPPGAFALTVAYVYDGDTIEATVHEPGSVVTTTDPIRIRLIGIDAPEGTPVAECGADAARDHLRRLLPEGSTVWAAPETDERDRHDRWLFNLWTDDGRFVNAELVAAGSAETMRIAPNTAFARELADAQAQAVASAVGKWGSCP